MTDPLYEGEKWMELMEEYPTLAFLVNKQMIEIDLDTIDPTTGTSTFFLTSKGWEVAFQLLLYQILILKDPTSKLTMDELIVQGRTEALLLLMDSMEPLAVEPNVEPPDGE